MADGSKTSSYLCKGRRNAAMNSAFSKAVAGLGWTAYCRAVPSIMRRCLTKAVLAERKKVARARFALEPFFICCITCRAAYWEFYLCEWQLKAVLKLSTHVSLGISAWFKTPWSIRCVYMVLTTLHDALICSITLTHLLQIASIVRRLHGGQSWSLAAMPDNENMVNNE